MCLDRKEDLWLLKRRHTWEPRPHGIERDVVSLLIWLLPNHAFRNQSVGICEKAAVVPQGFHLALSLPINSFNLLLLYILLRFELKEQICQGYFHYGKIRKYVLHMYFYGRPFRKQA